MRAINLLFLFCLFVISNGRYVQDYTARNYHERIGVPKANELFVAELLNFSTRIVGGRPAQVIEHPYQAGLVALLTTRHTSICGGSLISSTRILTAAHCWWDGQNQATQFTVVLGSSTIFSGGNRIVTNNIVVHPNWNPATITHDIAVARITAVQFNNNIQVIGLPTTADINLDFSGLAGTISGFGKTTDAQNAFPPTTTLHRTTVSIITNQVCQRSFTGVNIHGSHLCTSGQGGVGTCDGDSGGPLTIIRNNRRLQVGIVSFGLANRCQSGDPSVYTRITTFLPWINANL